MYHIYKVADQNLQNQQLFPPNSNCNISNTNPTKYIDFQHPSDHRNFERNTTPLQQFDRERSVINSNKFACTPTITNNQFSMGAYHTGTFSSKVNTIEMTHSTPPDNLRPATPNSNTSLIFGKGFNPKTSFNMLRGRKT